MISYARCHFAGRTSSAAHRLFDARLDLRDLVAQLLGARRELAVVLLAVADELLVQVLVTLTLLRDLSRRGPGQKLP